jgi:hypothetical protein
MIIRRSVIIGKVVAGRFFIWITLEGVVYKWSIELLLKEDYGRGIYQFHWSFGWDEFILVESGWF